MTTNSRDMPLKLIAQRLKALADPSRLAILHSLCKGEMYVAEIMRETGLHQANVSKHLRILREEGLVMPRRERKRTYYSISGTLHQDVCSLICQSLESKANSEREILKAYWKERHE